MYKLYIDDIRAPPANDFIIARSSIHAQEIINNKGIPNFISFDHDLGENDTSMVFLKWLFEYFPDAILQFSYQVHSANPIGKQNIISFLNSWKKSKEL